MEFEDATMIGTDGPGMDMEMFHLREEGGGAKAEQGWTVWTGSPTKWYRLHTKLVPKTGAFFDIRHLTLWLWMSKPCWYPSLVGRPPPTQEPILVVGLGCSLGVRNLDLTHGLITRVAIPVRTFDGVLG